MDLKGIIVLVTGAGSGIGAEMSRELAKAGARVALLDVHQEQVNKVAEEINGLALVGDVSDSKSIENVFSTLKSKWGSPRVCINCAGIIAAGRVVSKKGPMNLDDFRKVIEVNLIGTFNVLRLAADAMLNSDPVNSDGERGVIINTASVAAFEGQIGQAAYSASKGGVVGMTLPIARELGDFGVRVVAIAPGIIETPMITQLPEKVQESLKSNTVFPKRLGKPQEFAKLVLHIIDNPLINGDTLRLDGAVRMTAH